MKFLILFILAMVISSIGFKKFVWFISLGYGFSIAGIGVALLVLFSRQLSPITILLCVLLPESISLGQLCSFVLLRSCSYLLSTGQRSKTGYRLYRWYRHYDSWNPFGIRI